jgi:hypothetical protein
METAVFAVEISDGQPPTREPALPRRIVVPLRGGFIET